MGFSDHFVVSYSFGKKEENFMDAVALTQTVSEDAVLRRVSRHHLDGKKENICAPVHTSKGRNILRGVNMNIGHTQCLLQPLLTIFNNTAFELGAFSLFRESCVRLG
jgi:hypothetical protein